MVNVTGRVLGIVSRVPLLHCIESKQSGVMQCWMRLTVYRLVCDREPLRGKAKKSKPEPSIEHF
jgi:hypothetical protein